MSEIKYEKVGFGLIIISLTISIFFSIVFIFYTTELNWGTKIDPNIWGQYGGLIGGIIGPIVSLVGVFLLFETLKLQRIFFIRGQIEGRLFQLISVHRQNAAEILNKDKKGASAFYQCFIDFQETLDFVEQWYPKPKDKNKLEWQKELIQFSYLLFFYGFNSGNQKFIEEWLYRITKIEKGNIDFQVMFLAWKKVKIPENQFQLGHYYRNLFQAVNYINEQPTNLLSYSEKYGYIKTLRAQLSNYEQVMLLYNSISPLGEPWELNQEPKNVNSHLITKYNLIKNIPEGFIKNMNPKDYYPDVFFEYDLDKSKKRIELEKRFN